MISERKLARQFYSYWADSLPFLSPSFVRVFNEVYRCGLVGGDGERIRPISIGEDVDHNDLVAELGFYLAKISFELSVKVSFASRDNELRSRALKEALNLVNEYEGSRPVDEIVINDAEWKEAEQLASSYPIFLENVARNEVVEFGPKIPGAGFLGACKGDLSVGETLYEIKTVNRNMAGKDIRQLMVYLGLQWATGNRRWIYAGFFNPRRSVYYRFSVDHFLFRASGGKSSAEVFGDFIDFLSFRDFEVDTIF